MRSLTDLLKIAEHNRVSVMTSSLPTDGPISLYCDALRLIRISNRLTEAQATAALAHELVHAAREDRGHQNATVENLVDELASRILLTEDEYAQAERIYGNDPRTLARELETPVWVVKAFQRALSKTEYQLITTC